jgi:hypothetical protein
MVTRSIVFRETCSIKRRGFSRFLAILCIGAAALVTYAFAPAEARMGNSADLLGSEQADVDKIVLACLLGGACATPEGVFFRQFPRGTATLVWRGEATIEDKDNIPGIGFGGLRSVVQNGAFVDRLAWSGARTRNPGGRLSASVREEVTIAIGNGASKGCDTVIKTAADSGGQCQTLVGTLEGAPDQFDYLIEIDPDRFGESNAVVVTPCRKQVVAQCSTNVLESEVTIDAHRSLGGYDLSSIGTKRYP